MDDNKAIVTLLGMLAVIILTVIVCVTVVNVTEQRQEVAMAEMGFTPVDVNYSHTWVKLEEGE